MANLEIIDLVPNFIKFFTLANRENVNEAERWYLWKEHYNFAALPPGFDEQARDQLNKVWSLYKSNIEQIRSWKHNPIQLKGYLSKIQKLLGCEEDIQFIIVFFIGAFDNNAFVTPYDQDKSALCLPIENKLSDITIVHELTHIVHAKTAFLEMKWERPLAELIQQEGLALHASKYLVPGENDEAYIEMREDQGWLRSCHEHRTEIISGIKPYLFDSEANTLNRFTFGEGSAGLRREAYYAGWELVASALRRGVSFKELASINANSIPDFVKVNLI